MNNYFFPENNIKLLNFLFKNDKNYFFKKNIKTKENLKNKTLIDEDIYNFQDHSEIAIKSLKIANDIKLSNYCSKNQILDKVLKKNLVFNIEEILRTTFQLEKIKTHHKLQNLYLCKLFRDIRLFNYLKKNNYISKKIKISKTYLYLSKLSYLVVNFYCFLNLLFFPEKIFFLCRKDSNKKKYFAVYNFDKLPNFNNKNGYMLLLNKIKKTSIFVKELKMKESFFFNKKNKNSQNVILISDVFKNISFISYFLIFYKKYFFERFKLILSFNQNYIEKYRYFTNKICWEVFFHCFQVKKCFTAMLPCDLTSQIIQKKNSEETIFLYFSTSYNQLQNTTDNNFVSSIQYNQMIYSTLIANKVSIKYFNKSSNNFDKFLQFKPVTTCLSAQSRSNILLFKRKFNLQNKKIVAIFDNAFGYSGVLNNNEYLNYLKYLSFLLKKYKNLYFVFARKKKTQLYTSATKSRRLNFELKKMKNFKNFVNHNYQLTTSELIYLSDIVLTQPHSSVTDESILLGKTTAIFNNTKLNTHDYDYSIMEKKININDIKYKYRLLDKDILNLIRVNSKKFENMYQDKNVSDLINYLND